MFETIVKVSNRFRPFYLAIYHHLVCICMHAIYAYTYKYTYTYINTNIHRRYLGPGPGPVQGATMCTHLCGPGPVPGPCKVYVCTCRFVCIGICLHVCMYMCYAYQRGKWLYTINETFVLLLHFTNNV